MTLITQVEKRTAPEAEARLDVVFEFAKWRSQLGPEEHFAGETLLL